MHEIQDEDKDEIEMKKNSNEIKFSSLNGSTKDETDDHENESNEKTHEINGVSFTSFEL